LKLDVGRAIPSLARIFSKDIKTILDREMPHSVNLAARAVDPLPPRAMEMGEAFWESY
jgi:hypothetical protein